MDHLDHKLPQTKGQELKRHSLKISLRIIPWQVDDEVTF